MTEGRKLDLEINGRQYSVQVKSLEGDKATVMVDGKLLEVNIAQEQTTQTTTAPRPESKAVVQSNTQSPSVKAPAPVQSQPRPQASGDSLQAVMPGVVMKVLATEGHEVKTGEILLIIEAMKMENEIRAPKDTTISKILVEPGQKVQTGDSMITFK